MREVYITLELLADMLSPGLHQYTIEELGITGRPIGMRIENRTILTILVEEKPCDKLPVFQLHSCPHCGRPKHISFCAECGAKLDSQT